MLCSNKRAPFPARLDMPPKALAIRLKRAVAPAFQRPPMPTRRVRRSGTEAGSRTLPLEAPAAKIDLLEAGFRTGAQISSLWRVSLDRFVKANIFRLGPSLGLPELPEKELVRH